MKYFKYHCILLGLLVSLGSCKVKQEKIYDVEELIQSNELQRLAHMENNAQLLVDQIADTMISISDGQIQKISNQDIKKRFSNYFTNVQYTSWDDVQNPIIHLSEDGYTASLYVQKLIDIQHRGQKGSFGEHEYTLFAWNANYRKVNEQWKIIGNTSTRQKLSEEEAFELPINLSEKYASINEVDLIPEGVAYDHISKTVFLSSTYKQKIIAINSDGSYYDFKTEQEDGLWSTVGMEVDEKNKRLWVISFNGGEALPMKYPEPKTEWTAKLYVYQLPEGNLLNIFEPEIEGRYGFNDLCIDNNGGVYVSESLNNKIYYLNPNSKSFESLAIKDSLFVFPNGVTISDDQNYLYIATQNGIMQYNLNNKTYSFLKKSSGIVDIRIDGLAYYKGTLIGNQPFRNRILEFSLDEKNQIIKHQRILEANNPHFNQPATGEIAAGYFIYLANAQMRSGFENGVIKKLNQLDTIKLLKVKLHSR
ncbi:SMP-30/gluconolactonase/LRE family protein [Tenacibaculum sediminilitoris]|uniref:SMP-30/gluconolactonase/LRE family protein n=1 Tax=Tenacibaculum sediminilitoris TaxID=1820334 RepID=UPI0038B5A0C6